MKFDERFWVTMSVVGGVLGFDVLVYLVPGNGHLDAQVLAGLVSVLNVQGLIQAVSWWYQSSKSSEGKDQTIQTLASKGP